MEKLTLTFCLLLCLTFWACDKEPVGGEIKDTYWSLTKYKIGNKTGALNPESTISVAFTKNKIVGISTCNRYSGKFTVEETALSVTDISATKRACDAMNVEQIYLDVLSNATGYSVAEGGLIIQASNGSLTFESMSGKEIDDIKYAEGVGRLLSMFAEKESDASHHFYPIVRVDRPGNYPYTGKMIASSFFKYFDDATNDVWSNGGGDVLAIGKYGDFYICRVPGRYVSSDIAIFQVKDGTLQHRETIAWAWCDEGWCNQQDAWLQDINKDGRVDIVQHYSLTDDKGKKREERITVLLQDEKGGFAPTDKFDVDRASYKMAEI